MPTVTVNLSIKYSKNMANILTPRDLRDLYFHGIDTVAKDGTVLQEHVYDAFIASAQLEVEKYLGIKLVKQVVKENHHYHGSDWQNWGLIQTSLPVNEVASLAGYYGKQKNIEVPIEWLQSKKSSDDLYHRSVWLVPNGVGNMQSSSSFSGTIMPFNNISYNSSVPNFWELTYVTGFEKIPMDLYNMIGMLASVNIFNILGDLVLGVGIASQSIGLDGLSQSIVSSSSAENSSYGSRITTYWKQMQITMPRLREYYKGIAFTCM